MKPTLMVVLGAGASVTSGVPGTERMTRHLNRYFNLIVKRQRRWQMSHGFGGDDGAAFVNQLRSALAEPNEWGTSRPVWNFEDLLGALEELSDYAWRGSLVSRFSQLNADVSALSHRETLDGLRADLTREIHRMVGSAASRRTAREYDAAAALRSLIERLGDDFRLVALTLNYDDIADDAQLNWADGFATPFEGDSLRFNPTSWARDVRDADRHLLIHLHGSVRWGQMSGMRWIHGPEEPAKYRSFAEAAAHTSAISSHKGVDGCSFSAPYIISGTVKGGKLAYNPRPYGYYQSALLTLLPDVEALLLMGYGWGDEHVNDLINEFVELRPRGPVAVVTRRTGDQYGENMAPSEMGMSHIAGAGWSNVDGWAFIGGEPGRRSWTGGRLLLLPYGLPLSPGDERDIIEHLVRKVEDAGDA